MNKVFQKDFSAADLHSYNLLLMSGYDNANS